MKRPRLAWAFLPGGISCPHLPRCAGIRQSLSWLAGSHTLGQGQYCQCFFKDLGLKQPWTSSSNFFLCLKPPFPALHSSELLPLCHNLDPIPWGCLPQLTLP